MTERWVKVKQHRRSIHRNCAHCTTTATYTATRIRNGFRMQLSMCQMHAELRGIIGGN